MSQSLTTVEATRAKTLPRARRVVAVAGAALIVVSALADVYSISHHLRDAFGGHRKPRPSRVGVDRRTELRSDRA